MTGTVFKSTHITIFLTELHLVKVQSLRVSIVHATHINKGRGFPSFKSTQLQHKLTAEKTTFHT